MEKVVTRIKELKDTIKIQSQLLSLLPELEKGKTFDCIIEDHKEKRSLNANAYFHLLVDKLAKYHKMGADEMKIKLVLEYGAVAIDSEGKKFGIKIPKTADVNQFYSYAKWFGDEKDFDYYLIYKQTHLLDSKEMAFLIDKTVEECKNVGIETLEERELKKMVDKWEIK